MQDFAEKLEALLKTDKWFLDQEGDLLKSEVLDKAYKADKGLIESLPAGIPQFSLFRAFYEYHQKNRG